MDDTGANSSNCVGFEGQRCPPSHTCSGGDSNGSGSTTDTILGGVVLVVAVGAVWVYRKKKARSAGDMKQPFMQPQQQPFMQPQQPQQPQPQQPQQPYVMQPAQGGDAAPQFDPMTGAPLNDAAVMLRNSSR